MSDLGFCDFCKTIEIKNEEISILININGKKLRLYFCSADCLINFVSKKLTWRTIRLRDKK